MNRTAMSLMVGAAMLASAGVAVAQPVITRLTPPSKLFSSGDASPPIIARFAAGQRFDLHVSAHPSVDVMPGVPDITEVRFFVNDEDVSLPVSIVPNTVSGLAADSVGAYLRAFSMEEPGIHTLRVEVTDFAGNTTTAEGNFEIVEMPRRGNRARNVIVFIGDGMGIAHRTAARIMSQGVSLGKNDGRLAMDEMPVTGIISTHSLNSIVTDSSPGSACYSTGNKANNNQHGVFPDDTSANFDNPRVESIGEFLGRTEGRSLGIVTTSDVFDATPGAWASHTQSRGAGTGICDQYLDESESTGLTVLLGGGRKWFLPAGTPGSARGDGTDYVLPPDIVNGWGVPAGALDAGRDLIADFGAAGFTYTPDATSLAAIPANTNKLLGLYNLSNMNVALDKINGRRGDDTVVSDHGFPDQPMLDEMTAAALQVLSRNRDGFVLMVEAASIDKQAHNMDTERWILDTIEFDRSIAVARAFAAANPDTLIVVTADHECAGINIIGGSRLTDADLAQRATDGLGAAGLRNGVVGTYTDAGFPRYTTDVDGYPVSTNIDRRMIVGYAANADRYEDWRTNVLPLRDFQQPFNNVPPLNGYPAGPLAQDVQGNFLVTGQIADTVAAHTASDIPIYAEGRGERLFTGTYDNTDVFFKILQAAAGTQ